jgi:hypothetical protein
MGELVVCPMSAFVINIHMCYSREGGGREGDETLDSLDVADIYIMVGTQGKAAASTETATHSSNVQHSVIGLRTAQLIYPFQQTNPTAS